RTATSAATRAPRRSGRQPATPARRSPGPPPRPARCRRGHGARSGTAPARGRRTRPGPPRPTAAPGSWVTAASGHVLVSSPREGLALSAPPGWAERGSPVDTRAHGPAFTVAADGARPAGDDGVRGGCPRRRAHAGAHAVYAARRARRHPRRRARDAAAAAD